MNNNIDWQKCIEAVSAAENADIYIISGGMNGPADANVISTVKANKKLENALVLLTTFGGDADVAYRIARCFQEEYTKGKFTIFVPSMCKSAGTLVVIGAHQLVMTNNAQLGPLDVQLTKPDELGKMISGLAPVQALTFLQQHTFKLFEYYFLEVMGRSRSQITMKTAGEIATKLTIGMFQPIYSQLDPLRLGEYHQDMMVANEYGQRLNAISGNLKAESLTNLTHGYPSHGFVIDRKEAKSLFEKVRNPSEDEIKLADYLQPLIWPEVIKQDETGNYVATIHYIKTEKDNKNITPAKGATEDIKNETKPKSTEQRQKTRANKSTTKRSDRADVNPASQNPS